MGVCRIAPPGRNGSNSPTASQVTALGGPAPKTGEIGDKVKRRLTSVCAVAGLVLASAVVGLGNIGPASAAGTGAGFTSTASVDGTGHCVHGNEAVNCNAYDGKQYVWMNGGPVGAGLADGDYFFVVLSPSGQQNPNDSDPNNLSDDFDAYTNRMFSVSGGIVSYGGTHDQDGNKIRLADYADTTNPGGLYIMAICSLADGYPVDTNDCKFDAFKVTSEEVPAAAAPTIVKDAAGAYDNSFAWAIDKSVDKTTIKQVGGTATFNYTVSVSYDGGTISNVTVGGTIKVFDGNLDAQNNTVPIDIDSVTDVLSDTTVCTVTNGGPQTLTTFETDFAYTCALNGVPQSALDNTATVTWSDQFLSDGSFLGGDSRDFTFPGVNFTADAIDECINVTDTYNGTLGTACVGDANPTTYNYSRGITVAPGCANYENTASFISNDTAAPGSDSQTVTVCGPSQTSALTIGFWKNTNGNSLIQNYCAPAAKTGLATYLSSLGGGSGPFADAAGKSCSQLVTYVNAVIKGATSTNMNVMLRAQMLATALDVYFSDPAHGYTSTALPKTKPPSVFLTHGALGGFNMDMTAICPMVDNTTAGTATCKNITPSTDGFASGAFPASAMTVQALLDFEATTPPFSGTPASPVWYAGGRTKQEIAKNAFDQINNQDAFSA
jgi:hypothetical protein